MASKNAATFGFLAALWQPDALFAGKRGWLKLLFVWFLLPKGFFFLELKAGKKKLPEKKSCWRQKNQKFLPDGVFFVLFEAGRERKKRENMFLSGSFLRVCNGFPRTVQRTEAALAALPRHRAGSGGGGKAGSSPPPW